MRITRAEIQSAFDADFPVTFDLTLARVELRDPSVMLVPERDDIGLRVTTEVAGLGQRYEGSATIEGELYYEIADSTLRLKNPRVTDVEIPDLPPEYIPLLTAAANIALAGALPEIPLHEVPDGATKTFLKKVTVREGEVIAELGI